MRIAGEPDILVMRSGKRGEGKGDGGSVMSKVKVLDGIYDIGGGKTILVCMS
jgi:hypothetical protein